MTEAESEERVLVFSQVSAALKDADDRKLLWLLMNCGIDTIPLSPADAVLDAIQNRLYPEFDGDKVKITDYGWETPEGPIVYDQVAYSEIK